MSDPTATGAEVAPTSIAARVRALREELGLLQDELGIRCGLNYPQTAISGIETNRNKLHMHEARKRVAHGFYLRLAEFNDYLDGKATLAATAKLSRSRSGAPAE
jgi:transcriptional regulator with XRE-family HTH domain